jgi:hypothetical protein
MYLNASVHYRAHGSADGTYPPACRAADVTEHDTNLHIGLVVKNPTGLMYLPLAAGGCHYAHPGNGPDGKAPGGTWHWPGDCA